MRAGSEHHVVRRQSFLLGDHLLEFAIRTARVQIALVEGVLHRLPGGGRGAIGVLVAVQPDRLFECAGRQCRLRKDRRVGAYRDTRCRQRARFQPLTSIHQRCHRRPPKMLRSQDLVYGTDHSPENATMLFVWINVLRSTFTEKVMDEIS